MASALTLIGHVQHGRPVHKNAAIYIKRVETREKVIALTFDDGPNEPYTGQVLRILRDNGIRATFFLIGENVKSFPETASKIVKEGHAVGNHSYSHPLLLAFGSSAYQRQQLERDEKIIETATGKRCKFFRPPRGIYSPWLLKTALKLGLISIGWSDDGRDWRNVTSAQIADKIVRNAHPGEIILLHDGLNLRHGTDRSRTVQALPSIIARLKSQGYRFVSIPELLEMGRGQLPSGQTAVSATNSLSPQK
jgi:peptidoglycan/xylan/chitin deacetylase (PgdA/CDA1 family)